MILRYDVNGELLNIKRDVTNPIDMLSMGGGEVLVLSGNNEHDASSFVIMNSTNGVVREEVELSMGASMNEIEATSMCLGRGEWSEGNERRGDDAGNLTCKVVSSLTNPLSKMMRSTQMITKSWYSMTVTAR